MYCQAATLEKLTGAKVAGFIIVLAGICLVNGKLAAGAGNILGLVGGAMIGELMKEAAEIDVDICH